MDRRIVETALGCIFALGCWKASKENWVVAFIGLAFLAWAIKSAERMPFPVDLAVYAAAFGVIFGVMAMINPLWEYMKKYGKYAVEVPEKKARNQQS